MDRFDVQKAIEGVASGIAALDRKVTEFLRPQDHHSRLIPVVTSQAFTFNYGDLNEQQKTIRNGAEDIFITQVDATVILTLANGGSVGESGGIDAGPIGLVHTERGWEAPMYIGADDYTNMYFGWSESFFGFSWNYFMNSDAQRYGQNANGQQLISDRSLGFTDKNEGLKFRKPRRFKAGDDMTVVLQPESYLQLNYDMATLILGAREGIGSYSEDDTYTVTLTFSGYRDGRMAVEGE